VIVFGGLSVVYQAEEGRGSKAALTTTPNSWHSAACGFLFFVPITFFYATIQLPIMAQNIQIKTTFEISKVIQPIFTRGNVVLSEDGRILATCLDEDVVLTDLYTGAELGRIDGVRSPNQYIKQFLIVLGRRNDN
jgi:hypothetical protein